MSHSTVIDESPISVVMFTHDDFEGNVLIRRLPKEGDGSPDSVMAEFEVDMSILKEFVAAYVAYQKLADLEQASSDDVLFGRV